MTNARTAKNTREKAAQLRAEAARAEARRRTMTISAAAAAVIAVLVVGVILIKTAADDQQARETAASSPPANLYQDGILYGTATAPVTIEVYEDFQCPVCKTFEDENGAQIDAWVAENKVKVIYRPVSILDRFSSNEYSTRALNAVGVVVDTAPEAFQEFHTALFANQPPENADGLSDATLIELAVAAGADEQAITPGITDRKFATWVASTTDDFSKKGFTGTPTILLDGTKVEDWSAATFKKDVEAALG